ncbi:MAG: hypothetical protein JNK64_21710 [Myxococcales bacterium]|nr:hypothetical protein [Myxococcales bacterium]
MQSASRCSVLVAAVVGVAGLGAGCGSSGPAAQRAPGSELLAAADAEAIVARWQGAWVMPFRRGDPATSRIGTREVWAVSGRELTRWDGDAETTAPMTLLAPCLVKVGDRQFRYEAFAFVEGRLVVDGEIGMRVGGTIVACSDLGHVYIFDGTTCRHWRRPVVGHRFTSHPATCKVDGARFEATSAEDATAPHALRIDGELVRRDIESPRAPATRFDTLAAAKAALLE